MRNMPRQILAALLLAAAAAGCGTTIRGVIRDKPTGNPLPSVMVTVGKDNATTNAMGVYELRTDEVTPASVLVVNAPGYFMFTESVWRRDEGREVVRDVELVPRAAMTPRQ